MSDVLVRKMHDGFIFAIDDACVNGVAGRYVSSLAQSRHARAGPQGQGRHCLSLPSSLTRFVRGALLCCSLDFAVFSLCAGGVLTSAYDDGGGPFAKVSFGSRDSFACSHGPLVRSLFVVDVLPC